MSESKTLDKVVDSYIEQQSIDAGALDVNEVKKALKEKLTSQISQEIYDYHVTEIKKEAKKEIEEEKRKSTFTSLKQLMWEAFILAIVVGLLVNEITYLIEFLKNLGDVKVQVIVTVILIIAFTVLVLTLYVVKFTKDIIDKFVLKKKEKGKQA